LLEVAACKAGNAAQIILRTIFERDDFKQAQRFPFRLGGQPEWEGIKIASKSGG
jgi:hypothetical protein